MSTWYIVPMSMRFHTNFSLPQPFISYFTCLTFICSFPATSLPECTTVTQYLLVDLTRLCICNAPYLFRNQHLSRFCFPRQSEEDQVLSLVLYLYTRLQKIDSSAFFFSPSLQWRSSFTSLTAPVCNLCWMQRDPSHLLDWHVEPSYKRSASDRGSAWSPCLQTPPSPNCLLCCFQGASGDIKLQIWSCQSPLRMSVAPGDGKNTLPAAIHGSSLWPKLISSSSFGHAHLRPSHDTFPLFKASCSYILLKCPLPIILESTTAVQLSAWHCAKGSAWAWWQPLAWLLLLWGHRPLGKIAKASGTTA